MKTHKCPHCGGDISEEVAKALAERSAKGGRATTARKRAAAAENIKKAAAAANASYTPEKRRAAAQKRLETMARKAAEKAKES